MFVNLEPYHQRRDPSVSSDAIANHLRERFAKEIFELPWRFGPPPVRGVGRAGGFALMVEDRGDFGPGELQRQTENLVNKGKQEPALVGMFSVFRRMCRNCTSNPTAAPAPCAA